MRQIAGGRWNGRAIWGWDDWRKSVSERDAELTRDHMLHSPFASIEKAGRLLGFEPRYSAVEAAKEAVMWWMGERR